MSQKNLIIAQSGGPTTAINASLAGIVEAGQACGRFGHIYGALNGVEGLLSRRIIDLGEQLGDRHSLDLLANTPAMALGSCRYRMPVPGSREAQEVYSQIEQVFEEYEIGCFFYIGGNDSMDTAHKLSLYFSQRGKDIRVIGVPKTIDNDLPVTDHTPGFGSAAKFIATSVLEIMRDSEVYNVQSVTIVEIMGRNAGWLTAASCLPRFLGGHAPHLIYLPETPFTFEKFIKDVTRAHEQHKAVIVAVSEGVRTPDGNYAAESTQSGKTDAFGHKYLAGIGKYLEQLVTEQIGCKVRSIELNVPQRCSAHLASETDLKEARLIGQKAVQAALDGQTGQMMIFERLSNHPYQITISSCDIGRVAFQEKTFPEQWINQDGTFVTQEAFEYLLPLVQGEPVQEKKDGFPVHFLFDKTKLV